MKGKINMTEPTTECVVHAASALVIRPGDTLLVLMADPISMEQAARYRVALSKRLPGLHDVVILHGTSMAAYRPRG